MPTDITLTLLPEQSADTELIKKISASRAGVPAAEVREIQTVKRSIDARGRIKVNLTVRVFLNGEPLPERRTPRYRNVKGSPEIIIVGAGPAGLFAALRMLELGLKPVILERGKAVSDRKKDVAAINRGGTLDPDSNYAFGEGGAGTFSDGKLYTRSKKRGDVTDILHTLVHHGADPSILYDAHPHLGTDNLSSIIKAIRQTILAHGGEIHFSKLVTGLRVRDSVVEGACCGNETYKGAGVILATGHSARDVYRFLRDGGVLLEQKGFAMGVRVEHPQSLIDSIQYKRPERGPYLPAASYSLVAQAGGRGVYSFCMCPGGIVVPALTDPSESVVNGMSSSARNSPFANSGIVTEIRPADYAHLSEEHGVLAGVAFQELLEQRARLAAGGRNTAPGQRLTDFITGRISGSLPANSFVPGAVTSDFGEWLPGLIDSALRDGFLQFGRKMRGFVTDQAMIFGVESRTSSPVRIPRDSVSLEHPMLRNLYPCGEGAGYAGGIVSAAVDGVRCAEMAAHKCVVG